MTSRFLQGPWRFFLTAFFFVGTAVAETTEDMPALPAATTLDMGTTIIGDNEAAVGLFLMPWSEEPMGDVDRPPRLLEERLEPINAAHFKREAEWRRAQADYRSRRLQANY